MNSGERIRGRRESLGISRDRLAELSGLAAGTISNIEAGENVKVDSLKKLAQPLDVSVAWLLGGLPDDSLDRLSPLLAELPLLADDDIEVLAVVAKQLASARRQIAAARGELTRSEQRAVERATESVARAARLNAAEDPAAYEAGDRGTDQTGERGRRRSPRGDAGA